MGNEIAQNFSPDTNFLICLFARPAEQWNELFKQNSDFFRKICKIDKINFVLAEKTSFNRQIKEADAIYFVGGDSVLLNDALSEIGNDWRDGINNKTIIGSSAGTDMISKYNYDLQFGRCGDGLGLAPVKTFVHYGAKDYEPVIGWENALDELKRYKENLPIYTLKEGEFVSLEYN